MANDAPLFIVGTERSGSNLLRLILNSHPAICVPHPPHILFYFHHLEASYGNLRLDHNLRQLITDVDGLIRLHIYPWEIQPNIEELMTEVEPRDLYGVFMAYYNRYLAYSGKRRWGCKSTFMIHHVDRILASRPDARLLWLVRDPRDVAVSSKKSVFNPCHPWLTAELWRKQQQLGLDLEQRLPAENLLRLRYEDLVSEPEEQVQRICAFLNEDFDPAMLRFFETDAARTGGQLSKSWENHTRPIIRDNFGKYRKALAEREIRWVEQAAGEVMQQLGYTLDFPVHPEPVTGVDRFRFQVADLVCALGIEYRSLTSDRNHWMRWKRALYMAWLRALHV